MPEITNTSDDNSKSGLEDGREFVENIRDLHERAKAIQADESLAGEKRFKDACELYDTALITVNYSLCTDECVIDLFFDYAYFLESYLDVIDVDVINSKASFICDALEKLMPVVNDDKIATIFCALARIHYKTGKYECTEKEYTNALNLYFRLTKINGDIYEGKYCDVLNKIADTHHKLNENEEADVEYQWARIVYYRLVERQPEVYSIALAKHLKDYAYMHKDLNLIDSARQEINEAWERTRDFDEKYPDLYDIEKATLYYYIGNLFEAFKIDSSAKEAFEKVKNTCEKVISRDDNNKEKAQDLLEKIKDKDLSKSSEKTKNERFWAFLIAIVILLLLSLVFVRGCSIIKNAFFSDSKLPSKTSSVAKSDKKNSSKPRTNFEKHGKEEPDAKNTAKTNDVTANYKNNFEKGLLKYRQRDYSEALTFFKKAAEEGNASAMYYIGLMFENGCGVQKDYFKAEERYEEAAKAGYSSAEKKLNLLRKNPDYLFELGLKNYKNNNFAPAIYNFKMAANENNSDAMYYLGIIYEEGRGTKIDYTEAEKWYENATKLKNSNASQKLDALRNKADYLYKLGVKNYKEGDYKKALYNFQKAADKKNSNAMCYIGEMYVKGYGVEIDLLKAAEWYEKAVELGNPTASSNLAVLKEDPDYLYNLGVRRFNTCNYAWAIDSFSKAAAKGDSGAMYYLGLINERGYGGKKDPKKALEWYEKAAALGNQDAQKRLAEKKKEDEKKDNKDKKETTETIENKKEKEDMKENKKKPNAEQLFKSGLEKYEKKEYSEARGIFLKAADQNHSEAMRYLGSICLYPDRDNKSALKWYQKAAELNNTGAMFDLGNMYQSYPDILDINQSIKWFEKAANLGNIAAMNRLAHMYREGEGVPIDYAKARKWLKKSADSGDAWAKSILFSMDKRGK